jgi:hypothetical protein
MNKKKNKTEQSCVANFNSFPITDSGRVAAMTIASYQTEQVLRDYYATTATTTQKSCKYPQHFYMNIHPILKVIIYFFLST